MIFVVDDVLYILVEFQSDRMNPRKNAKNGRIGAQGLNCIIFVIFFVNSCLAENFENFFNQPGRGHDRSLGVGYNHATTIMCNFM